MKTNNSVLISGYYGFDNSGDDAILKAIVKDIREHNPKIEITVLSNNPSKTESMYPVDAINRFKFQEVLRAMKNSNLFISGGGSLLQDVTSTRSLLYYLMLMKLAKWCKKPVMIYANGIGPINKKVNRFLTKKILNKVDIITLRDEGSKEYVYELGIKNNNIIVTADPVFTLDPAPQSIVREILQREKIPMDKKFIGISIRQWKTAENLIEILSELIKSTLEKFDVNILLIPMHHPEDLEISMELKNMVNQESCYVLTEKYSVEEIMGIIKELEIIIAMRLHSLIYAATQEVPMVGLSYDPKVDGILKSLGMDYICNVDKLDYNDLIDKVEYVWENKVELSEQLKIQDEDLRNKAIENVRMALDLLKR